MQRAFSIIIYNVTKQEPIVFPTRAKPIPLFLQFASVHF